MTTPDSPLAAAFVAAPDHWPRNGAPIRAICAHMAEGGGTVQWLLRPDGNSSTYVCEFSGRIVQMVPESLAAGSLDPTLTRTTNDAAYIFEGESVRYGITVLKAALGTGVADPNRAVIAIETEGFAKPLTAAQKVTFPKANPAGGPNAAQRKALKALVNDIRRRRGALPVIGHRDQQSYKACPGHAFPWADYGGHGVKAAYVAPPDTSTGDTVGLTINLAVTHDTNPYDALGTAKVNAATTATKVADGTKVSLAAGLALGVVQKGTMGATAIVALNYAGELAVLPLSAVTFSPLTAPSTDCAPAVASALAPVKAELATTKTALTQADAARVAALDALDDANEATAAAARVERERIALAEADRIRGI